MNFALMWRVSGVVAFIAILVSVAAAGLSMGVIELSKETRVTGATLTDVKSGSSIVAVREATAPVPLFAVPTLPPDIKGTIRSMTVHYEPFVDEGWKGRIEAVMRVASIRTFNLTFAEIVTEESSVIRILNGVARLFPSGAHPDEIGIPLCASNVTCASIKVDASEVAPAIEAARVALASMPSGESVATNDGHRLKRDAGSDEVEDGWPLPLSIAEEMMEFLQIEQNASITNVSITGRLTITSCDVHTDFDIDILYTTANPQNSRLRLAMKDRAWLTDYGQFREFAYSNSRLESCEVLSNPPVLANRSQGHFRPNVSVVEENEVLSAYAVEASTGLKHHITTSIHNIQSGVIDALLVPDVSECP